jgi:hypothetical protein
LLDAASATAYASLLKHPFFARFEAGAEVAGFVGRGDPALVAA